MSNDTMKVFDSFLREWCESRGWPYQPEMTASDKLRDADTRLRDHVRDAQEYWAEVEGTDEYEMREFEVGE